MDSKNVDGPIVEVSPATWSPFLAWITR
ncbi:DUF397 domain-containing protein [Streptomyces goshikiensis]